ncbi:MAG: protein phosphatase CheZ [Tepidamorphaceae bacterium]|nr:protein phosphatase CheZ [Rhodobiaceae bacterium]MCC0049993.1 protein phosphatase CheZ [Rhodobiaceae bacterium]
MSDNLPAPISEDEYAAIEAAVMETARGRWFLAEYTRRNRNSDTKLVLDAVSRLEGALKKTDSNSAVADVRLDLMDMAEAISRTRREIRSLQSEDKNDRFLDATEELDAVVGATENATNEILAAAEKIQEVAWHAMERGEAKEECAKIDELIIDIYTGCSFQDITGQRIQKVVQALRYVESRVNAMIDIWNLRSSGDSEPIEEPKDSRPDAHLLNGPAKPGTEIEQDDIDSLMAHAGPDMAEHEPNIVDPEEASLDWNDDDDSGEAGSETETAVDIVDLDTVEDASEIIDIIDTDEDPFQVENEEPVEAQSYADIDGLDEDLFDKPEKKSAKKLTPDQTMALFS